MKKNQSEAFRDLDKILEICKLALCLEFIEELSIIMCNTNTIKFISYATIKQKEEYRNCRNHSFINKYLKRLKIMNKEERNKF